MSYHRIWNAVEIGDGETVTSFPIPLRDGMNVHAFQYEVSGAGTLNISVQTGIDGANFVENGIKAAGVGATSGPDSDGKDVIGVALKPAELLQFKAASTGATVLTLWFTQK